MHNGKSLKIFKDVQSMCPGVQVGGFSDAMRSLWAGLTHSQRRQCVSAIHSLGVERMWRKPLGVIPDGYFIYKDKNGVLTVDIFEIEVTSFLSEDKAYTYMVLSEVLLPAGVNVWLLLVDRYGNVHQQDPEWVWMNLALFNSAGKAA